MKLILQKLQEIVSGRMRTCLGRQYAPACRPRQCHHLFIVSLIPYIPLPNYICTLAAIGARKSFSWSAVQAEVI